MKNCYVAGAGDFVPSVLPKPGDFVIAADAGLAVLRRAGVSPDLIVGDFDSLGEVPDGTDIVRHPVMKDDTDLALAVSEGAARGFDSFVLNGTLGGRLDHTLANIQLLRRIAEQGGRGVLVGPNECLTAVHNGALRFSADAKGYVSVFCLGDRAEGVDLEGLLYPLRDAALTGDRALGVCNEFTGAASRVAVRNGTLLVVWRDSIDRLLPLE